MSSKVMEPSVDTMHHTEEFSSPLLISTSYSCSTCQNAFRNLQEQRAHMKEPWHVNNIKRRIESLPPVSRDEFDIPATKETGGSKTSVSKKKCVIISGSPSNDIIPSSLGSDEESEISEVSDSRPSPFRCLFCNDHFDEGEEGLTQNLTHMRHKHNFQIPNTEKLSDKESLIGYLATEIHTWHECLYCGASKDSTLAIQSHMRDKGHCALNMEREPELSEFWETDEEQDGESSEDAKIVSFEETEIHLPSGKIIGSKSTTSTTQKTLRKQRNEQKALIPIPDEIKNSKANFENREAQSSHLTTAPSSSSRQLSRREEMSLTGVSPQQRQILILAEKKAQRTETVARRAREWANAKNANKQEFDQLDNRAKHGKQNHKLLPR